MKKIYIILLGLLILSFACSKKTPPVPYAETSLEYQFFTTLSEKVPVLEPSKSRELVKTKSFSIYTSDILPFLYARLQRFASNMDNIDSSNVNKMIRSAGTYMAEKRLLVDKAEKLGVTVPQDTLETILQNYYTQAGGEEKFFERNAQMGLTKEYFMNDVKESLMIKYLLENEIYKGIEPTEQELLDEYNKDKTASVRHILLLTNGKTDEEKAEIKKNAEDILAKARAGEDFAELAKQHSEDPGSKDKGGLYENFGRGRMVKEFEDASFNLPIGSVSDLVETRYGFHIIKIVDRQKEEKPFEEVKDRLSKQLFFNKQKSAETELLETLKKDSKYQELFSKVL